MERIGIYGGTFNPPHVGHMRAAQCALERLQLDKLYLIPDRIAPHKILPEGSASAEQRLEMVRMSAEALQDARVEVSDLELRREGPSYSYITVGQIRQMHPSAQIFLLMGTDMFLSFLTWRNAQLIWEEATLAVFCRGERNEMQAIARQREAMIAVGARVELIDNPVVSISSTDLRTMLLLRCAGPYLMPGVEAYIREKGLYRTNRNLQGLSDAQLEEVAVSLLKPERVNHVLGCRDTAVAMARVWGVDETDAARAGLLHDVTKALSGTLQLTFCREYGMLTDDFSQRNPKILHALTGAMVARHIFGEKEAVVQAIRWHTTGRPNMTTLEKIIYVADYMEPNRDFPGVEELRRLAFTDLDGALRLGLTMTLDMLKSKGGEICADSQAALEFYEKQ